MKAKKLLPVYIILLVAALICMFMLWQYKNTSKVKMSRDYPQIKKEGILRVVTEYNAVGYYVSGDTIQGFQYELCKSLEKYWGLKIEIHLQNNLETCIEGLLNQDYDIIARNIPVTTKDSDLFSFTIPITLNRQVLVQRTAEYNKGVEPIRNQIELAKKVLYVPQNSPSLLRLHNLSEEIADTIYIKEETQYESEQLIYMVAHGDIDFAVVDRQTALAYSDSLPQIDISTDISFTQLQAWAVRKDSPILLDSLNSWLNVIKSSKTFDKIRKKYL